MPVSGCFVVERECLFPLCFFIELYRPVPTCRDKSRLALRVILFSVGFHPTLFYVAPLGLAMFV